MPDSNATLIFDGLEIIYFRTNPSSKLLEGTVLLLQRDDHTPSLDIVKVTATETIPMQHDLDITQGMEIALDNVGGAAKDSSFGAVLNLQSKDFHKSNLKFRRGLTNRPIRITVKDGTFSTPFGLVVKGFGRFEIHDDLSTTPPTPLGDFSDLVVANIRLPENGTLTVTGKDIAGRATSVPLPGSAESPPPRYIVSIKNVPVLSHHHHGRHPNGHGMTHFFFYYDVLEDTGASPMPQFDLDPPRTIPPQNCDPITLDPPPPDDGP